MRGSAKTKSQLEKLAAATNLSKSFLATEALERYLELEAWQIKEIKQALKEADAGSDILFGGAGNYIFVYKSISDSLSDSFDYLLEFFGGDKIDLKGIDANTALKGDQAFTFKTSASTNAVWWNTEMLYGDVNGDAVADFGIHVSLVGLSELRAVDIAS